MNWSGFCRIAGATAVILLLYSLVTMAILVALGGMPATAREGFDLLAKNRLVGLLRLDALTILAMPLYYLLLLGLFGALKEVDGAKALLGALLGFVGVTLVLATPSAFSFLTLSDKFVAATDETQKTLLLAAGEAVLASTLLLSLVMLRSADFSKITAWVGVVMHGLDLPHILVGFFLPAAGVVLMMVAGPLYLVWFPLLARDFFRMAQAR